jgi:uncharacterized protein YlxW (UPF0749 family)
MAQPAERIEPELQVDSPVSITPYLNQQQSVVKFSFWRLDRDRYVWALVTLLLGILITAQLRSKPATVPVDEGYAGRVGATTIERLEAEQTSLKQQISDLRKQIAAQQQQSAQTKASFADISASLEREQRLAGLTPLSGPGLTITLDDSTIKNIPPGEEANYYLVHEFFLRDVLNILWAGGAEAVSLNGERIVPSTSVYCVGTTILVNSTRLSPPYVFLAIGDAAKLQAALNDPAALLLLRQRVQNYGLQFSVEPQAKVSVPAFDGTLKIKYAQPGLPAEGGTK